MIAPFISCGIITSPIKHKMSAIISQLFFEIFHVKIIKETGRKMTLVTIRRKSFIKFQYFHFQCFSYLFSTSLPFELNRIRKFFCELNNWMYSANIQQYANNCFMYLELPWEWNVVDNGWNRQNVCILGILNVCIFSFRHYPIHHRHEHISSSKVETLRCAPWK